MSKDVENVKLVHVRDVFLIHNEKSRMIECVYDTLEDAKKHRSSDRFKVLRAKVKGRKVGM